MEINDSPELLKAIFAGTIAVKDPDTKENIELEIWKDPSSGAIFAVDSSFLDQINEIIRSPFNENVYLDLNKGYAETAGTKTAFTPPPRLPGSHPETAIVKATDKTSGPEVAKNIYSSIEKTFDPEEIITILEAAKTALADGEFFDNVAEQTDIFDDDMISLRDRLQEFMDKE